MKEFFALAIDVNENNESENETSNAVPKADRRTELFLI